MRIYNVTTKLKQHSKAKEETRKDTIILGVNDDLHEFIQMMYGSWFDIVSFEYEEADVIHISKSYIKEEAMNMLRISFE